MVAIGKTERYINEAISRSGAILSVIIDPLDWPSPDAAVSAGIGAAKAGADLVAVGGSMGAQGELLDVVTKSIKEKAGVPVALFPGNIATLTRYADAVYFMSLLNSRNAYWITRAQMLAADIVRHYKVEPLPVGYVVVEPGGTVGYVGDVQSVPRAKPKIAAAYALAAQYMGFRFLLTDAGSNPAEGHIPLEMIKAVSSVIEIPYIVGGGIRTPAEAKNVVKAGADIIQVGTAFEKKGGVEAVKEFVKAVREGSKR